VIERKTGDGAWLEARVVAANTTQATDLDLSADTLYTYRVRAQNLVDVSTPTNEASARTLPNPPAPPNGLTVQALTQGALSISWTDNSNNEEGFQVEQWDGSQFNVVATVGVDVTAYNHSGLAANTYYIYQVQAFNSGGLSGSVQTVGVYTLPSAPANLTVATVSQTELDLSWTDTNPNPSGHEIERSTDGVNFNYRELVGGGVTNYQDTGLLAGTRYYYRLRAVNGAGPSPYSNIASASTQIPSPPAAPSNLTGTALSSTQVRLSWRDNSANETEFRIERSLNGKTFTQIGTASANVIQFTSTGLAGNTKYWFRVRAANIGGMSGYSNVINLRTPKR
jgi:predicted phage tail protein